MEVRKISFVGEFTKLYNEEGIARSFEELGIEVQRFPEFDFQYDKAVQEIEEFKPDLILFAKLQIPNKERFLSLMKGRGIPTASWTFDLYFGLRRESYLETDPIFRADFVFGPDGGHDKEFKEKGINYHLLRQGIYGGFCYKGIKEENYPYDIIFTGSVNKQWLYREEMAGFLSSNYNFKWIGKKIGDKEIRGKGLNDLYASAKIIMGDSVYSSHYWSNRIYETLGRGGFIIHPQVEGLENDYIPYKHYIPYPFGNWDKLKEKIDYFLPREKEREAIALAGMEHTKNNHTLVHRCRQLLDVVNA